MSGPMRKVVDRQHKRCDWISWGVTLVLECGHLVCKSGSNKKNAERHNAFYQTKSKCAECAESSGAGNDRTATN